MTSSASKLSKVLANCLLFLCCVLLTNCATQKRLASLSPTYLDPVDPNSQLENLPFQHSWVTPSLPKKPPADGNQLFTTIYIKPIRTDLIPSDAWKRSKSSIVRNEMDFEREKKLLASYFRSQLSKALKFHEKRRYRVVREPRKKSLTLDIALTELVLSHPIAKAGALAAPIPGTSAALSAITDPHVAFAMRVVNTETGELLATAADRKFSPIRIIDLNKLTVASTAREICQDWSTELADTLQHGRFSEVSSRGVIRLLPW